MTYMDIIRKDSFTMLSLAISNTGCGTRIPMEDVDMNQSSAPWIINDTRDCLSSTLYYGHWSAASSAGKKHNDAHGIGSHYLTHDAACWITFNSFVGTFRSLSIATHLEDVFMWSQRYMTHDASQALQREREIGCWPHNRILQVSFTNTSDCANDDRVEFLITLTECCYMYISTT